MHDILLDKSGDISVSEFGDISITESIRQAVKIKLRWIYQEWRLGPELGFRWFEDVLVKNPNIDSIGLLIKEKVLEVDGIITAEILSSHYDPQKRKANYRFSFSTSYETYEEEVTINV